MNSLLFEFSSKTPAGNIVYILEILGIAIDGSCAIFLFNEFRHPKSPLRTPYFVILVAGLVVIVLSLLTKLIFPIENISSEANWDTILVSIVRWIVQNGLGIWIFFLGLNRCTAIMSPTIHKKVG